MRNLRLPFATLVGPWVALGWLGLDIAVAVSHGAVWIGDPVWTVRWAAIGLYLGWPLVAAAAAVDAALLSRTGHRHLAVLPPRRRYLWAARWSGGLAAGAHLVVIAAMLAVTATPAPRVGWGVIALAVAAQAVTLLWFGCFGSLLGRFLSPVTAGILSLIAAFGLGFALTNASLTSSGFTIVGDSGASVPQVGLTWNTTHLLVQLALLGASAVLLAQPLPRSLRGRLLPTLPALLSWLIVAGAFIVATVTVPGTPMVASHLGPDVCVGSHPRICTYSEQQRIVGPTVALLQRVTEAARQAGYTALVPTEIDERDLRGQEVLSRPSTMTFTPAADRSVYPEDLLQDLISPGWCPALQSPDVPPPDGYFDDSDRIVGTWLRLAGISTQVDDTPWNPDTARTAGDPVNLTAQEVSAILTRWSVCELG